MVVDLARYMARKAVEAEETAQTRLLEIPSGDLELAGIAATLRYQGREYLTPDVPEAHIWTNRPRKLRVVASLDFHERHGLKLLHVSLSHPDRLPDWAEVLAVRGAFFPDDLDCAMLLPRAADYINAHKFTFHIN